MGRGFECGDGWFELINELSSKLESLIMHIPEASRKEAYATQVKQKYGLFRFYMHGSTKEMGNLIQEYERRSGTICEKCGKPGITKNRGGGISTLCELCAC